MDDKKKFLELFSPFLIPCSFAITVFGIYVSFTKELDTINILVGLGILFTISLTWALWYILSNISNKSKYLEHQIIKEKRHTNKIFRRLVFVIPILSMIGFVFAFSANNTEEYYNKMMEGGGPFTPILVLDSNPRGANIRIAKIYYGDDDPNLVDKSNANIVDISEKTPTRIKLYQGQYWVVFELKGKCIGRSVVIQNSQVVKVEF